MYFFASSMRFLLLGLGSHDELDRVLLDVRGDQHLAADVAQS